MKQTDHTNVFTVTEHIKSLAILNNISGHIRVKSLSNALSVDEASSLQACSKPTFARTLD